MAVAFVQAATGAGGGAVTAITATFPAAAVANNLLYAVSVHAATSAVPPSNPSGYTAIASSTATGANVRVMKSSFKIAAGGETSAVWASTGTFAGGAVALEYSGIGTSPIISGVNGAIALSGTAGTTPVASATASRTGLVVATLTTNSAAGSSQQINSSAVGVSSRVNLSLPVPHAFDLLPASTASSYSASETESAAGFMTGGTTVFTRVNSTTALNLTGTSTSTASIVKQVNKLVFATGTSAASIAKVVNKALTFNPVTTTATVQKVVNKPLSATVTTLAFLTAVRVAIVSLLATVTTTGTITKLVNKRLSATSTTTATLVKVVNKILTATSTTTASIKKLVNKTLGATVSTVASLITTLVHTPTIYAQALTATVTSLGDICTHRILGLAAKAGSSLTTAAATVGTLVTSALAATGLTTSPATRGSLTTSPMTEGSVTTDEEC